MKVSESPTMKILVPNWRAYLALWLVNSLLFISTTKVTLYKGNAILKRRKSGPVFHHLWHGPLMVSISLLSIRFKLRKENIYSFLNLFLPSRLCCKDGVVSVKNQRKTPHCIGDVFLDYQLCSSTASSVVLSFAISLRIYKQEDGGLCSANEKLCCLTWFLFR